MVARINYPKVLWAMVGALCLLRVFCEQTTQPTPSTWAVCSSRPWGSGWTLFSTHICGSVLSNESKRTFSSSRTSQPKRNAEYRWTFLSTLMGLSARTSMSPRRLLAEWTCLILGTSQPTCTCLSSRFLCSRWRPNPPGIINPR